MTDLLRYHPHTEAMLSQIYEEGLRLEVLKNRTKDNIALKQSSRHLCQDAVSIFDFDKIPGILPINRLRIAMIADGVTNTNASHYYKGMVPPNVDPNSKIFMRRSGIYAAHVLSNFQDQLISAIKNVQNPQFSLYAETAENSTTINWQLLINNALSISINNMDSSNFNDAATALLISICWEDLYGNSYLTTTNFGKKQNDAGALMIINDNRLSIFDQKGIGHNPYFLIPGSEINQINVYTRPLIYPDNQHLIGISDGLLTKHDSVNQDAVLNTIYKRRRRFQHPRVNALDILEGLLTTDDARLDRNGNNLDDCSCFVLGF